MNYFVLAGFCIFGAIGLFIVLYGIVSAMVDGMPNYFKVNKFKIDDCGYSAKDRYQVYQLTIFQTWSFVASFDNKQDAIDEMYKISKQNRKPKSEYYDLSPITDKSKLIENNND